MSKLATVLAAGAILIAACRDPGPPPPGVRIDEAHRDPEPVPLLAATGEQPAAELDPRAGHPGGLAAAPPGGAGRQTTAEALPRQSLPVRIGPLCQALIGDLLERAFEAHDQRWDLVWLKSTDRGALDEVGADRCPAAVVALPLAPVDHARGLTAHLLGAQVAVVAVTDESGLNGLTEPQLRLACTGRAREWNEIAYQRGEIQLCSGPVDVEYNALTGLLLPGATIFSGTRRARSTHALLERVKGDPLALAITSLAAVRSTAGVRAVAVQGIDAAPRHVAAGRYPFVRRLSFAHAARPLPGVRALLEYATSETGRAVLSARVTTP